MCTQLTYFCELMNLSNYGIASSVEFVMKREIEGGAWLKLSFGFLEYVLAKFLIQFFAQDF